jgi:hypothetical protein
MDRSLGNPDLARIFPLTSGPLAIKFRPPHDRPSDSRQHILALLSETDTHTRD